MGEPRDDVVDETKEGQEHDEIGTYRPHKVDRIHGAIANALQHVVLLSEIVWIYFFCDEKSFFLKVVEAVPFFYKKKESKLYPLGKMRSSIRAILLFFVSGQKSLLMAKPAGAFITVAEKT